MDLITRACINPNATVFESNGGKVYHRTDFDLLIDRWKIFLIKQHQAEPGITVAITADLGALYYALFFACCELGMILTNVWPTMNREQDVADDRLSIIGGVDLLICERRSHDPDDANYNPWNHQRDLTFAKRIVYQQEFVDYKVDDELLATMPDTIWATPNSSVMVGCSSGTTGDPKRILDTHKKVYRMATRYGPRYAAGDKILHSTHAHIALSGPIYLLPGFMFGTQHFTHELAADNMQSHIDFIVKNQINQYYCFNAPTLLKFLTDIPRLEHALKIFTLIKLTRAVAQLVHQKNISRIVTAFGDSTIGHAFFLKYIDQDTDLDAYDENNQGPQLDDFYEFEIRNKLLYISIPQLGQSWMTSKDLFELRDGEYVCLGRSDDYEIAGERFSLRDIEQQVAGLFGDGAHVFFDADFQRLYLAVWEKNDQAEKRLNNFLQTRYQSVRISAVLENIPIHEFYNDRKIDSAKVRRICRNILKDQQ